MIIYHQIHKAQPKNFKKNSKTPKPRFIMDECMKMEKIRTLTKCFDLDLGRRTHG